MARKNKKPRKYPLWYVWLRKSAQWTTARLLFASLALVKKLPADAATNAVEQMGRRFGMYYPRTAKARENLRHAFPQMESRQIETVLRDMWGSLSRTAAEYAFLDQIFDFDYDNPTAGRFEIAGIDNFLELRELQGPAICFTAHTANWEILPVAAAAYGVNITALFRPPNNPYIAREVLAARLTSMGHLVPSKAGASWALADVLDAGGKVGLLVDQFYGRGLPVEFFGRRTLANPLLARLARRYDCPVYPARCIRLPGGKFRIEMHGALDVPRTADGHVDVVALTQMVHDTMEGWIREFPGQWLWLHNRWRRPGERRKRLRPKPRKRQK